MKIVVTLHCKREEKHLQPPRVKRFNRHKVTRRECRGLTAGGTMQHLRVNAGAHRTLTYCTASCEASEDGLNR